MVHRPSWILGGIGLQCWSSFSRPSSKEKILITIEISEKAASEASGALQDISVQGQNRMIAINLTIVAGGISKEGHRRTRLVTSGLPRDILGPTFLISLGKSAVNAAPRAHGRGRLPPTTPGSTIGPDWEPPWNVRSQYVGAFPGEASRIVGLGPRREVSNRYLRKSALHACGMTELLVVVI